MSFSKVSAIFFGIVFIIILYAIIVFALKIMYKDVKSGGRKRPNSARKSYGIEVVNIADNSNIKNGSVIPIRGIVTVGRKAENAVVLVDPHVSGQHAKFLIKNNILYVEDLNSTNGTFVNDRQISGKVKLFGKDEIRIGTTVFRVL
ncbi:MAG: FHA domain-containing protein [Clostridium sp.]|jgi:pSer/pThr/pTyr-binding forkhead associated (FHA) protein|nr:FHA domain-containing protein [Clostridium sp.]